MTRLTCSIALCVIAGMSGCSKPEPAITYSPAPKFADGCVAAANTCTVEDIKPGDLIVERISRGPAIALANPTNPVFVAQYAASIDCQKQYNDWPKGVRLNVVRRDGKHVLLDHCAAADDPKYAKPADEIPTLPAERKSPQ